MTTIHDLQPARVWQYFHQLTQIPRPSFHEEAVQQYVLDEAKRLGLPAERDAAGNICVRKPASPGHENAPGVILQSHLDMVPQKNADKVHDFEKDPITTKVREDGWLTADGTTLGADNGIGAATALAVLADETLEHPPLEALFTSTEETGMVGAQGLQPNWLNGKYLINLDTEEEGELCIGCAGGVDGTYRIPYSTRPVQLPGWQLTVKGLKGGHSGMDIIKGRGNAILVLVRVLEALQLHLNGQDGEFDAAAVPGSREALARGSKQTGAAAVASVAAPVAAAGKDVSLSGDMSAPPAVRVVLADLQGGNLRNAIPREAHARIGFLVSAPGMACENERAGAGASAQGSGSAASVEALVADVQAWLQELQQTLRRGLPPEDAGLSIMLEPAAEITEELADAPRVLDALRAMPNGVDRMTVSMPGLVETSTNLAAVACDGKAVHIRCLLRSSDDAQKADLARRMASVVRLAGGTSEYAADYSGWQPKPDSDLVRLFVRTGEKMFGRKPPVSAIHAGLECGIMARNYPHWEMISFGPTITGAHSPDEAVKIDTVGRFYDWLKLCLRELAQEKV